MSAVLALVALNGVLNQGRDSILTTFVGVLGFAMLPLASLAVIAKTQKLRGKGTDYLKANSKWHVRGLGLSLLFLVLCNFVPLFQTAMDAARKSDAHVGADATSNYQFKMHSFSDMQFSIATPDTWTRSELPALRDRGFELKDSSNQLVVVVCATPKSDVVAESLEVVNQLAVSNVRRTGANHVLAHQSTGVRNDISLIQTVVDWENGPSKVRTMTRQMNFPDHWVEIDIHCSPSAFLKHEELLTRIVDSVREKETR